MVKIENLEVMRYEFRCTVSPLDLTEKQCEALGLDIGNYMNMQEELSAGGDFIVRFDYDQPIVYIENFAVVHNGQFIDLNSNQVDFKSLAEAVENLDDGTWAQDKADAAADYFFDTDR